MDYLDTLKAEVTSILDQKELSSSDLRRLSYLESQIIRFTLQLDY